MPNEKNGSVDNDGVDSLKRVAAPYLTWVVVALGSSGTTLAVSPFVDEEVLGKLRGRITSLETENTLLKSELTYLKLEIARLPPEWLRREIEEHDTTITDHEKRLDALERGR